MKKSLDTSKSMGMGQLGNPNLIFVRKFRWTLEGTHISPHFMKSAKINYTKKEISFSVYEIILADQTEMEPIVWAENLSKEEELVFTTYDGCGTALYEVKFHDLELVEQTSDFDYGSSEESCINFKIKYGHAERTYKPKESEPELVEHGSLEKEPEPEPIHKQWTLETEPSSITIDIKLEERPSVSIEETEINFLNGKTWIPGKAEWSPLKVDIESSQLGALFDDPPVSIVLAYSEDGVVQEKWKLLNPWIQNLKLREKGHQASNTYQVTLRYNQVEYKRIEDK